MTQCERIMRHLESGKPLTSAEAMSEYGIHRLASRICDLKKLGYPIAKRQGKSKNRYGEVVTYAEYYLGGD